MRYARFLTIALLLTLATAAAGQDRQRTRPLVLDRIATRFTRVVRLIIQVSTRLSPPVGAPVEEPPQEPPPPTP